MSKRIEQLTDMLAPIVEDMELELWGIEYLQGRGAVLRIYIDHEDGINVDQCVAVSHQVSGVLDVEDPIPGEYTLEVSSPGMDRPLFYLHQYPSFVGEKVDIKLLAPVLGRRKMLATIEGVNVDENVVLVTFDGESVEIPYSQIDRARIVPVFD